jgi:hypothetical protein
LDEAGKLQAGDAISLVDYGITSLWDTLYVVSATKMYYPDREALRRGPALRRHYELKLGELGDGAVIGEP